MVESIHFMPYNAKSKSASMLSRQTGYKRIMLEGSKYRGRANKRVINWGNANPPAYINGSEIINVPDAVDRVSNKLTFFRAMTDVEDPEQAPRTPEWTQDKVVVEEWLAAGKTAFARTKLRAHSGRGIIDVIDRETLAGVRDGTLFVKYVPKKQEWRIHLMCRCDDLGGQYDVVVSQRKVWRQNEEAGVDDQIPPNWRVRNHDNGFIFERNGDLRPHEDVIIQARKCMKLTGLHFGAVDVIFNQHYNTAYVLEVNSAPGLEGSTVTDYVNAFENKGYFA